jgi:hypothetical protein
MDPFSASASLLTILGAAGSSIKCIHQLVLNFKDAPADIEGYRNHLECLYQTITCLTRVYKTLPPDFQLDARISRCLREFTKETGEVHSKLERKLVSMGESRGHRMRESFRWLLFDRKVKKYFASLEHWNTILSQTAAALQM